MTSELDEHYIRTNVEWSRLPSDAKQVRSIRSNLSARPPCLLLVEIRMEHRKRVRQSHPDLFDQASAALQGQPRFVSRCTTLLANYLFDLVRRVQKDSRKYYDDLLRYSREHLMLYVSDERCP